MRATLSRWLLPSAVAVAYALAVVLQEKITVGKGLGWDGVEYGRWALDFPAALRAGVSDYYVQRLLPSAVVYAGLKLLGIAASNATIIKGFELSNAVLVTLSAASYDSCARRLGASDQSRWLGAVGLFGSFAILKFSAFDPVLTDVWAFAFGLFQLHLALTGRSIALMAITAVGAFAWPTILPAGVCLLFYQAVSPAALSPAALPPAALSRAALAPVARAPWRLNELLAACLVVAWVWLCWPMSRDGHTLGNSTGEIDLKVVRLSLALSAVYLFAGARKLLDDRRLYDVRTHWRAAWSPPAALAVVLFGAILLLRSRLSNGQSQYGLESQLEMTVFSALKEPGIFALAHVLYWGPLVLVVMLCWSRVVAAIQHAGPGMTLLALAALVLSLNSESRKLASLAPLFFVFALPVLDQLALHARRAWFLGFVCLLFSRVWITFEGMMKGDLAQFPGQMLFMIIGPWMNPSMYLLQTLIVLLLAVELWRDVGAGRAPQLGRDADRPLSR